MITLKLSSFLLLLFLCQKDVEAAVPGRPNNLRGQYNRRYNRYPNSPKPSIYRYPVREIRRSPYAVNYSNLRQPSRYPLYPTVFRPPYTRSPYYVRPTTYYRYYRPGPRYYYSAYWRPPIQASQPSNIQNYSVSSKSQSKDSDESFEQDPNSMSPNSKEEKELPPIIKCKDKFDPSDTTIDNKIRALSDNLYSFKGAPDEYNPADLLITPHPRPVNEAAMISPDKIAYIPVLPMPPCDMKLFPDTTPSPFPYVPSEPSIYMPETL